MQNRQIIRAKRYLFRWDQILEEMGEKMLSQEMTNSITVNFIDCMIPHHQMAIYMSENLLEYTTYEPLQRIANHMIKRQTEEIEQIREIAKNTYGFRNMPKDANCYWDKYLEITKVMLEKMKNAPRCIYINLNFINEMIPHHEGAIAMCENVLLFRIDPRLKVVADSIIKEQRKGIKELKEIEKILSKK